MPKGKRKVTTMEELSGAAGVSRPTLSKFFHDPDSVRASIRERIESALEVYDYRPNIFAINQNRASTKTIGILVPYLSDPFFAEIVRFIERLCIEAGYWPILFSSHGERQLENDALATMQSLRPAGALLAPLGRSSDMATLERFCDEVPTILFDSELPVGEAFVGSDNRQSIGMMVDYLCETGEPPCFLHMPPVNPNARKRRAAYVAAMERLGLAPQVVDLKRRGWDFEQIGLDEGKRLLCERALPSSTVLCSNDRLAVGFIAAAYETGHRVGRGHGHALRIAGHDDHPSARFTSPALTTVAQDYSGIATRSVERLFGLFTPDEGRAENGDLPKQTLLPGTLVPRESA